MYGTALGSLAPVDEAGGELSLEQEVELVKSVQILTCMLDVLIVQFNVQVPHYLLLRR